MLGAEPWSDREDPRVAVRVDRMPYTGRVDRGLTRTESHLLGPVADLSYDGDRAADTHDHLVTRGVPLPVVPAALLVDEDDEPASLPSSATAAA